MTRENDEDLYSFQTVIPGQMIDNGYNTWRLRLLPHDVKVVCCRVVWQKAESPVVNFH
jgi:hypothetical protein